MKYMSAYSFSSLQKMGNLSKKSAKKKSKKAWKNMSCTNNLNNSRRISNQTLKIRWKEENSKLRVEAKKRKRRKERIQITVFRKSRN